MHGTGAQRRRERKAVGFVGFIGGGVAVVTAHTTDPVRRMGGFCPFSHVRPEWPRVEGEVTPLAAGCQRSGLSRHTQSQRKDETREHVTLPRCPPLSRAYAAFVDFTGAGSPISSFRLFSSTFTIGIVISSTPSCIVAFAPSDFTPSGSGTVR